MHIPQVPDRSGLRHLRMAVVTRRENVPSSTVTTLAGSVVLSRHDSNISQDCGRCGAPLLVGVFLHAFDGLVVRCSGCRSLNGAPWMDWPSWARQRCATPIA